jgi:hypothetical protein
MEQGNINVLTDAKEEYTKRLISIIKPCVYQGIKSIYADAKDICMQDNTPDKILMTFQDLLARIPKWSQDIINKEFERICNVSKCDYIDDLLRVVYVCHIKVLTVVHSTQKNKKISLKVPSGGHFIHLCYIEAAREFWKDPYLFSENVSKYELQKNMRDSENMIGECVYETVRKLLPVRYILKELLNEPDEEIEEEPEDIKTNINAKYMKRLETVVKKELKTNTSNPGEIDLELIRRVIKEELDSRPKASESNVIKKELVDTVVEKIVEQSETTDNNTTTAEEQPVANDILATANSNNGNDPQKEAEPIPDTTVIEPTPAIVKADNEAENELDNKAGGQVKDKQDKQDSKKGSDDIVISSEPVSESAPVEIANPEAENMESANTLSNLLGADGDDADAGADTGADDDIPKSVGSNIVVESAEDKKVEKAAIQIQGIDEINLNLDELDGDLETVDLDMEEFKLPSGNGNSNGSRSSNTNGKLEGNPIKAKDANTKYIFFSDAK